jgi:hypothetical protein
MRAAVKTIRKVKAPKATPHAGGAAGKFDPVKHPRDTQGHWITTGGGVRRIQEGTKQQRDSLAREIRNARKGARTKLRRHNLARLVRTLRGKRRAATAKKSRAAAAAKPDSLDAVRRKYADDQERDVARGVGGVRLDDYEPHDVIAPKGRGKGDHAIEVKSLIYGKKEQLSVHENALLRKVEDVGANPDRTYHTIVLDKRNVAEGGAHEGNYSGHDLYYRRASGPYTVATMHKVKDMAELRQLLDAPNESLPAAARGEFPAGHRLKELRARAAKEKAYNDARSKERKARLGAAAYGR